MKTRKPLRRTSKKRSRQDRQAKPTLRAFAAEHGFCWACLRTYFLDTHHSCGRHHPQRNDRRLLGRYCCYCHESRWTNPTDGLSPLDRLAQQLAYKFIYDREFYDREFVLECRGYDANAITELEIWQLAKLIKESSDG